MNRKKLKTLSPAALTASLLPAAALIPVLLKITLTDGVRTVWAGANIVFILLGLLLSILCVRSKESRSAINVISLVISFLWLLLIAGIIGLAITLNLAR